MGTKHIGHGRRSRNQDICWQGSMKRSDALGPIIRCQLHSHRFKRQVGDMYPFRDSDVVFLQEFDRSGARGRLLDAPVVDLKALLTACLDRAETRLRVVPEPCASPTIATSSTTPPAKTQRST